MRSKGLSRCRKRCREGFGAIKRTDLNVFTNSFAQMQGCFKYNFSTFSRSKEEAKMVDWRLAFLVSGAGYGINILVLIIISLLIWLSNLAIKSSKKTN
jgi:hypothetical protein